MSAGLSDLKITPSLSIPIDEIMFSAVRSQGPGGQNVNKVASAIHLRFDVESSSLPEGVKARVLAFSDSRISDSGIIVIKAQSHRSQIRNREDALKRLKELFRAALHRPKTRRATRPSYSSTQKRLKRKTQRGQIKSARGRVRDFD